MFDISRKFTVHIEGRGDIRVTPNDHVASGGEGHVYRPRSGPIALKIWDDPARATSGRMIEKVNLLSALKHPMITAPENLVRDKNGNVIGYTMSWVNGWDLPLAFTNDWRAAHAFSDTEALAFASKMREVVLFTHAHNVVMGDANELNILGVNNAPDYIDVDPWLPPGFHGDKIMPTVFDWHASAFSKEADWFAWGVVTFQLLTGTHPYRGSHPDFKRGDLEGRMKANVSVFSRDIRLNAAVRPLANIPASLLEWYRAAFQDGVRTIPPDICAVTPAPARAPIVARVAGSGRLVVTELFALNATFARVIAPDVLLLADGSLVSLPDGRIAGRDARSQAFVRLPAGAVLGARSRNGDVCFTIARPGESHAEVSGIAADRVWGAANRLFAITRDGILELNARDMGAKYILLSGLKWSLNPNATIFGDGAAVLDALGAKYLVVPQPGKSVAIVRAAALDHMKPISIISRGKIIVASMIDRAGAYHRGMFTLSDDLLSCQSDVASIDNGTLTDVVTDSGLVLWITAAGELGVLAGRATSIHPLAGLANAMLATGPSGVFCVSGNKVFRLSMSGP